MKLGDLATFGLKHIQNHSAQSLYLHTGVNWTTPTNFCGLVTHQCNLFCGFCFDRKDVDPAKEMGLAEWQQALLSIKELVGEYFISFSGGEVMLMKWFPELLKFCADNGIKGGVLTNGTAINEKNAELLVAANPFELSVSADGPNEEIHDHIRGYKGSFEKVKRALILFREERERQQKQFPIIVRCVINRINLPHLPDMIQLVEEVGATSIIFQPVHEISDKVMWGWQKFANTENSSFTENFWVQESEFGELDRITDHLISLKKNNAPIMNTERDLKLIPYHFKRTTPTQLSRVCTVSLRNFFIQPNGDVQFCHDWPPIGNLRVQSAKEIWQSEHAESLRKQSIHCDKQCLVNCSTQRTLLEKAEMALHLLRQ